MSRHNPLEPLEDEMALEHKKRDLKTRIAKIAVGWFIAFIMVASLLRYTIKFVW